MKVLLPDVTWNIRKNNRSKSKNIPFNMPTQCTNTAVHIPLSIACPFWVAMFVPSTHSDLQILSSMVRTCLVLKRNVMSVAQGKVYKRGNVLPEISGGLAYVSHTAQLTFLELYGDFCRTLCETYMCLKCVFVCVCMYQCIYICMYVCM
jgi:hypothetical protein